MDTPQKVVIVVPTIRENHMKDFLAAWAGEFKSATIVVVEDNAERTFDIGGKNIEHYCHQDIDRELGRTPGSSRARPTAYAHLGYSINSGSPAIKHLRASNVWANLRKEAPGLGINETFWKAVDAVPLRGSTFRECYREIANGLEIQSAELPDYFPMLKKAMLTWTELFSE
jgi:reversibly glycosylated polypeptide